MNRWKSTGLWLAVFACAGLGGWGGRLWEVRQARAAAEEVAEPAATPRRARMHMPISLSPANTRTADFPLTREAAERAARAGVLRVALLDGTYYDVRIDNQTLDAQGHWSISGHAKTRLGPQAMVLTYGERAVFGALPLPDGRVLQVRTEHGRALIGSHAAFPQRRATNRTDSGKQGDGLNVESFAPGNTGVIGDTINITVLGLYTDDLLALRDGDVDAIATEFASMLAIANQAHMDSASLVRFANAGLRAIGTDFANNDTALAELAATAGVREARDATGADLVTLLRPRGKVDTTCGAALRGADRMARSGVTDSDGFSVANVAPCGPYTLAHELGHNLGNAHEREAEMSEWGELRQGAHAYAFAYRTKTFATLDAEAGDLPVIGRFSNPRQNDCDGQPCGIEGVADNVRSMQSMAPDVAAYRGSPGTISIADAMVVEPASGYYSAIVPIRITGPVTDELVTVEVVGGTAKVSEDFSPDIQRVGFDSGPFGSGGGPNERGLGISIKADAEVEGPETIELRITRLDTTGTTTIERANATLTIVESEYVMLTGRLRAVGTTLPNDVYVAARGAIDGGPLRNIAYYRALAPDYSFAIPIPAGRSVQLELPIIEQVYAAPVFLNEMRASRNVELFAEPSIPVEFQYPVWGNGDMRWTMRTGRLPPVSMTSSMANRTKQQVFLPPGARLEIVADRPDQGTWGRVYDNVRAPIVQDVPLSITPSVYVDATRRFVDEGKTGDTPTATFVVRLSAPSAQAVGVHYRTVDGTAKAGSDYVAKSGDLVFEPGQTFLEVPVTLLGDDKSEYPERFELLIESASGAIATNTHLGMTIADDDLARADGPAIR